jgi:hypothetical protein
LHAPVSASTARIHASTAAASLDGLAMVFATGLVFAAVFVLAVSIFRPFVFAAVGLRALVAAFVIGSISLLR